MNTKKIILYYAEWLLPLTMGPFFILTTILGWQYFPAYILASLIGGTLFFPVNVYIFKHKCYPIKIKVNGKQLEVNEGDNITI